MGDNSRYCVIFHGDGRFASLVVGFANVLNLVRTEVFGGQLDPVNVEEWESLKDEIEDESSWTHYRDSDESRFHYTTEIGEDCRLVIYRIWDAPTHDAKGGAL